MSNLFIISGPSGVGKTSVVNRLLDKYSPSLVHPLTYTTREPRPGEANFKDMVFMGRDEWINEYLRGEFLATNEIYREFYGTKKKDVFDSLKGGKKVILVLDSKGAQDVRLAEIGCVSIFIGPETFEKLEESLRRRWPNGGHLYRERLVGAIEELGHQHEYDYKIKSDNLDEIEEELIKYMDLDKHV